MEMIQHPSIMASLPLPNIPLDLMFNILANLPARKVLDLKCVCKDWFNRINDPSFIESHLNKCHRHHAFVFCHEECLYLGDNIDDSPNSQALVKFKWYYEIQMIGTCNGLVCIREMQKNFLYVCNPSTRMFEFTLWPIDCSLKSLVFEQLGFGYDTEHDDYKIVLFGAETWIYSLTSKFWTTLEPHLHKQFDYVNMDVDDGTMLFGEGMLHCLVRRVDDDSCLQIVRFNISLEEWDDHDMGLPELDFDDVLVLCRPSLSFFEGCFCFSYVASTSSGFWVEIWIMKEYGVKESWTKLLRTIPESTSSLSLYQPLAYSRTRPQVIWFKNNHNNKAVVGVACYEMNRETTERFELIRISETCPVNVNLCVESLVSIPGSSIMSWGYLDEVVIVYPAIENGKEIKKEQS